MNAVQVTDEEATLCVDFDELAILVAAVNEVCNGVHISDADFKIRLGVPKEQARLLLRRLSDIYKQHEASPTKS